jgi:hypothetical protein
MTLFTKKMQTKKITCLLKTKNIANIYILNNVTKRNSLKKTLLNSNSNSYSTTMILLKDQLILIIVAIFLVAMNLQI